MKRRTQALAMLEVLGLDRQTLQHIDPNYGKGRKAPGYRPQVGDKVNTEDMFGRPIIGTVTEVFAYNKEALLLDADGKEHAALWREMTKIQEGA